MFTLGNRMTKNRRADYRHWYERLRIFVSYGAVQVIAQGLGFLAGIIIVRALPKEDYALFMIVNTIGPVMNMLSDVGISSSLSAIGGKFWQDDTRMGVLLATAMRLRWRLIWISAAIVTPFLGWMLFKNHASAAAAIALVLLTLVGVILQLNSGVLGVLLSLRQQVSRMQRLALLGIIPRLVLILVLSAVGLLNAPLVVAAGTVGVALQFWLLKQWVYAQVSPTALPDAHFQQEMVTIIRRQAPLTIYFCVQGQIGLWLISVFGSVQNVAEVGALGRISALFAIIISTISGILIPRFARCQELARLRQLFAMVAFGFGSIISSVTLFAWACPGPLLWLLGKHYADLDGLVWLAVLSSGVGSFAGLMYGMNVSKGWIPNAIILIPAEVATQIVLCAAFDISTVRGVLLVSMLAPTIPIIYNSIISQRHLWHCPKNQNSPARS